MIGFLSATILGRLFAQLDGVTFASATWVSLFLLLAFGLGQLFYSVLRAFLGGAREGPLIVGGAFLALALLILPWTSLLWILPAGVLLGLAGLYLRAWRQRATLSDSMLSDLERHVVMIDQEGRGLDIRPKYLAHFLPIPRFEPLPKDAFAAYLDTIIAGIREADPSDAGRPRHDRVVIFVHGGLNEFQDALLLSAKRLETMREEPGEVIYPIFLLWRSGLIPCYWSHLTEFQQGRTPRRHWLGRTVLALANLVGDLGRGLTRLPKTAYYQVQSDATLIKPGLENAATNVTELYNRLRIRNARAKKNKLQIKKKDDQRTRDQDVWLSDDLRLVLELLNPLKMLVRYGVWPLIDALATSAWNIMLRRTHTLLRSPYEFDVKAATQRAEEARHPYAPETNARAGTGPYTRMLDTVPSGGLAMFARAYLAAQDDAGSGVARSAFPGHTTLIGHSMGTIVVNHWLRLFPDFKVREIVYLAAACRIDEAFEVVNPYLRRSNATFHTLCLHPKAERSEQHVFGLSPLGSLLEWIDNFFTTPLTFDERTLGKWDNILQATHLIDPNVRDRVHIKAFSIRSDDVDLTEAEKAACRRDPIRRGVLAGRPTLDEPAGDLGAVRPPVAHADFTSCRFWQTGFYRVSRKERAQSTPEELAAEAALQGERLSREGGPPTGPPSPGSCTLDP